MKRQNFGWRVFFLGLSLVFCGLSASDYCQASEVALLVQCTPSEGGAITPSAGIHYFPLGSEVKLVAVPKSGYHFLYWLGDVGDPQSMKTVAKLEGHKIVIAVFEKIFEEEFVGAGGSTVGSPERNMGGGGGVSSGWGPRPPSVQPVPRPRPIPRRPIAEPSTVLLFGLAAVMLRRKKRPL